MLGYIEDVGGIPIPNTEHLILGVTTLSLIPKLFEIIKGLPEILTN